MGERGGGQNLKKIETRKLKIIYYKHIFYIVLVINIQC